MDSPPLSTPLGMESSREVDYVHDGEEMQGRPTQVTFVAECVSAIISTIVTKQSQSAFSQVVIGLSGGSTPIPAYETLATSPDTNPAVDWSRVVFFLIDERYVPTTDPQSNYAAIAKALKPILSRATLLHPNTSLSLDACVSTYASELEKVFGLCGTAQLVILGMGPDHHIASWFPPLTAASAEIATDPNYLVHRTHQDRFPVADRITVSMYCILSADRQCLLISGAAKVVEIFKTHQRYTEWRKSSLGEMAYEKLQGPWNKDKKELLPVGWVEDPMLAVLATGKCTVLYTPPHATGSAMSTNRMSQESNVTVIILGASGHLAKRKTYPAIFGLFCEGLLPRSCRILGYARTQMTSEEHWNLIVPNLSKLNLHYGSAPCASGPCARDLLEEFKELCQYNCGNYDSVVDWEQVCRQCCDWEGGLSSTRIFYVALPPHAYIGAIKALRKGCWSTKGINRVILEKPFGRDSESAEALTTVVTQVLKESEIYRMDHYLGKEMAKNLMVLRFGNLVFRPLFHRQYVRCVRITMAETTGLEGRAGYFDEYGIIRDVIQNHLIQLLVLMAMEQPGSLNSDDIRDEKVKVLRHIVEPLVEETVVGQYVASLDGQNKGYRREPGVPKDSLCATYAVTVLRIDNERWAGVPFVLKSGKGLDTNKAEIRIQFQPVAGNLFRGYDTEPNELVIAIQPTARIYMKMTSKVPGLTNELRTTELDLTLTQRFAMTRVPEAYERLILNVMNGVQENFLRTDELHEAWRIFTPLLHAIDARGVLEDSTDSATTTQEPMDDERIDKSNDLKQCIKCGYQSDRRLSNAQAPITVHNYARGTRGPLCGDLLIGKYYRIPTRAQLARESDLLPLRHV